MDTRTGAIVNHIGVNDIEYKNHVLVQRDLTEREKYDQKIKLYSPCGCGSGKKFKFCCKKREK